MAHDQKIVLRGFQATENIQYQRCAHTPEIKYKYIKCHLTRAARLALSAVYGLKFPLQLQGKRLAAVLRCIIHTQCVSQHRLKGQQRGTRNKIPSHTHSGPSSCHYCGHQAKLGAMNTSGAEHLSLVRPREVLMEP